MPHSPIRCDGRLIAKNLIRILTSHLGDETFTSLRLAMTVFFLLFFTGMACFAVFVISDCLCSLVLLTGSPGYLEKIPVVDV